MGIDYLTIAADGTVYPCHKLVGHASCGMGNVRTGSNNDRYKALWSKNVLQRERCDGCEVQLICGGYCLCDNYFHNGDFFKPTDENCELIKHNILLAKWLIQELEGQDPQILKRLLKTDYWLDSDVPIRSAGAELSEDGRRVRQNRTGGVYELNAIAAWILNMCNGENNVAGIMHVIAEKTNEKAADIAPDVKKQLVVFREAGLIEFHNPEA